MDEAELEDTKRRRGELRRRVKADLARTGHTSADLDGMQLETRVDGSRVVGWTLRVMRTGGRDALAYAMDNADGAELHRDGEVIESLQEVN